MTCRQRLNGVHRFGADWPAARWMAEEERRMKIPGPDHPITVETSRRRVRAKFEGHVIADTDNALILREASYPPVYYFPKKPISMWSFGK